MKHAFLIIAHDEFQILKVLLSMLDDERNDIYVHIDKKISFDTFDKDILFCKKARLFLAKKRIDVRWGDISQIKTELLLLENAYLKGPYDYYHFMSGVDLPIKSQDYIHRFFEYNKGWEFVSYSAGESNEKDMEWKIYKYHLFTKYYKIPPRYFQNKVSFLREKFLKIQEHYHYNRASEIEYKKGSNWVSITHDLAKIVLEKKKFILNRFKYVCCGDEIFIQSILWNSERKDKIYAGNEKMDAGLRAIDWDRGRPYVWKIDDLPLLLDREELFARKFNSNNIDVVFKIKDMFA